MSTFKSSRKQAADCCDTAARGSAAEAAAWRRAADTAEQTGRISARSVKWARDFADQCDAQASENRARAAGNRSRPWYRP